jgi:glycosyltransferase involved in cell wall biosynthesis
MKPLVSVVTPTWQRHERLLNRCIPSVQAQTYQQVEHVIVSDGPDAALSERMLEYVGSGAPYHSVRYTALAERTEDRHWGHIARNAGADWATGELIAYLDDDDAYRPEHVALLAQALADHPEAGFAYSLMVQHYGPDNWHQIGGTEPVCNGIGTPMVMHRRELLDKHGGWGPASATEDWELFSRWLQAGVAYVHVPVITVDVWPSSIHEHS